MTVTSGREALDPGPEAVTRKARRDGSHVLLGHAAVEHLIREALIQPARAAGFGQIRVQYADVPVPFHQFREAVRVNRADDSILLLMQCEHVRAVEHLEEILAVDGVDAIICGPMDLSASIGKMGRFDDPEVMDLFQQIIDKCKKAGKPFGISIGVNYDLVKFWVDQGASFASMGTPADYFYCMSKDVISSPFLWALPTTSLRF